MLTGASSSLLPWSPYDKAPSSVEHSSNKKKSLTAMSLSINDSVDRSEPSCVSGIDSPVPSKRQLQNIVSSSESSAFAAIEDVPYRQAYEYLTLKPDGIAFLFDSRFSLALDSIVDRISVTHGRAQFFIIGELRRFLAIKVFVNDINAEKISPTPISMLNILPKYKSSY